MRSIDDVMSRLASRASRRGSSFEVGTPQYSSLGSKGIDVRPSKRYSTLRQAFDDQSEEHTDDATSPPFASSNSGNAYGRLDQGCEADNTTEILTVNGNLPQYNRLISRDQHADGIAAYDVVREPAVSSSTYAALMDASASFEANLADVSAITADPAYGRVVDVVNEPRYENSSNASARDIDETYAAVQGSTSPGYQTLHNNSQERKETQYARIANGYDHMSRTEARQGRAVDAEITEDATPNQIDQTASGYQRLHPDQPPSSHPASKHYTQPIQSYHKLQRDTSLSPRSNAYASLLETSETTTYDGAVQISFQTNTSQYGFGSAVEDETAAAHNGLGVDGDEVIA